ncbi:hypothetical protein ACFLXQ_06805 [Chloroflexota bacterium]
MEGNIQTQSKKREMWYIRLDKFLLYLLAVELGYFIFLMLAGVIVTVLVYLLDFAPDYYKYETSILWPVLVYIFALPLNMLGGFASIVLNIRTNHQGYPGTGHLLNWIFLMTTGWLFMVALVFMFPLMARGY